MSGSRGASVDPVAYDVHEVDAVGVNPRHDPRRVEFADTDGPTYGSVVADPSAGRKVMASPVASGRSPSRLI